MPRWAVELFAYVSHVLSPHSLVRTFVQVAPLFVASIGKLDKQRLLAAGQRACVEDLDDLLALFLRLHSAHGKQLIKS